ncbi:MAG: P-type Cu2+ transporter [Candidatus Diapherotrites archaeon]|nr:P-type Cu2+ transporter [Candidatus Diapherotrites archaeon]MDN5366953.1 P-type Cu2+ transporter [Candidatus Diapherotrites archaeon]
MEHREHCHMHGKGHIHEHHAHAGHDHAHHVKEFRDRFFVSLLLTIPVLLLSDMIQMWFGFSIDFAFRKEILTALATLIYIYGGWPFLRGAVDEVKKRQPGMMTLVAMAISVAFIYSVLSVFVLGGRDFFWELATLVVVMLLGHWIEAKSVSGASKALEELAKLIPKTAHLVRGEHTVDVPASELKPGDVVLVKPGEKIPADGVIIEGETHVDESLLTGESRPVHKKDGDEVIGGSVNGHAAIKVRVTKAGNDTYVAQMMRIVREAQQSRTRTQDLANRAAGLLFYVALGSGVATYTYWTAVGMPAFALERMVTVLVIACPHALGLAIPLVVAISTAISARNGVLVRNRRAFEAVKDVDVVVFDKTGTLTEGKFGVVDVLGDEKVIRYAAALERGSEHVIGQAVVEHARAQGINIPEARDVRAIPGKGITGVVKGKQIYVGNERLMKEIGVDIPEKARVKGRTVIHVAEEGKYLGSIALADRVREESREAVKLLKSMGKKVYMLTGDAEDVAAWVAKELGIDGYFAEVLPDQKAEKIKELQKKGYKVAMVGDGVNDAPALVTADVGIAIGAGTDVAIESADIVLVRNDPRDVAKIIDLSKKTYAKMVQNLWWAAGYNIVAIPLAAGILYNYGIVLSPAVGALLMSLSTVIVAVNAATLSKYRPPF